MNDDEIRKALASIPVERAPASLRRKLKAVPRRQRALERPGLLSWYFQPRWLAAFAAVPLALALLIGQLDLAGRDAPPSTAEIAQARADLALAFSYLGEATLKAGLQLDSTLEQGLGAPVTEETVRAIREQLDLNKEQDA